MISFEQVANMSLEEIKELDVAASINAANKLAVLNKPILDERQERPERLTAAYGKDIRRCQAISRNTATQCKLWRVKGSTYCHFHGRKNNKSNPNSRNLRQVKYTQYLNDTLRNRVDELQKDDGDTLSLEDEILINRSLVIDCLKLYDEACKLDNKDQRLKMQVAVGATVRDALGELGELITTHVKIRKERKELIDRSLMNEMVNQVARIIDNELTSLDGAVNVDPQDIALKLTDAIRNNLSPEEIVQGTRITPDSDMTEMVNSVPLVIEDKSNTNGHTTNGHTTNGHLHNYYNENGNGHSNGNGNGKHE